MSKETIKKLRVEAGLSQERLAQRIGITRQTVNLIEAGRYNPCLRICQNLARELNTSLNVLFEDYAL